MGKLKVKYTGRVLYQSDKDFDWSAYDGGYDGGNSLVVNRKIKTLDKDKVFCHEPYAQELYDMMNNTKFSYTSKDSIRGNIYSVVDIKPVSNHEVVVDSNNGMSAIIDINKEHQFINSIGCNDVNKFIESLHNSDYKKELLNLNIKAKVSNSGRISLWDAVKSDMEAEFMNQLRNPDATQYAYKAKVLSVGNGGYTVSVNGVECFLPGSHATSGPVSDFNALVGKELMVCVINYSPSTSNFVVSYKKYLEKTLPSRIENELSVGMKVTVKVTGISNNGVFAAIKDESGEYIFPSLLHRSCMSTDFEESFNNKEFVNGDVFKAYIHRIENNNGSYRIVLGDKEPVTLKKESEKDNDAE